MNSQENSSFLSAYAAVACHGLGAPIDDWVVELVDEFPAMAGSGVRFRL